MTERLEFYLLGRLTICIGGIPVTILSSAKARALLAYLSAIRRPVPRSVMAGLLWSDLPEEDARRNLRVEIQKIRQHLSGFLEFSHQELALNDRCWADVDEFESIMGRQSTHLGLSELEAALDLYRGEFLQDFSVRSAPLFEEWLLLERERYRQSAIQLMDSLIETYIQSGKHDSGIQVAKRMIAIDPWREKSHRILMRLLSLKGDREAALAQYELLRRILSQELATEPSAETNELYQRIRIASLEAPAPVTPEPVQPIHHNLPAPTTGFVGREIELEQIISLLKHGESRLITLVGTGGIGKTRLAQQVGWKLAQSLPGLFTGGIFFIPLATAYTEDILVATIANTLGLTLPARGDPWEEIFKLVSEKPTLLILDNFEGLIEYAPRLANLLKRAAGCHLLVTSRQLLDLYEEWVLPLDGLTYPQQSQDIDWRDYSGLQLFHQQARRKNLHFSFDNQLDAAVRLCQILDGLPLGIELAAAWVHLLSCQEIVDRLLDTRDLPKSAFRNLPERQRSLRAVLQSSWDLLTDEQRLALTRSSAFLGGFTLTAAERVCNCDARTLASLVGKSLLKMEAGGRYELHSLIQVFAGEFLSETEKGAILQAHARYYATLLTQLQIGLAGPDEDKVLRQIEVEIDNLRMAWNWLITQAVETLHLATNAADIVLESLEQFIPMLSMFYLRRGWYREAETVFNHARCAMELAGWAEIEPISRAPFVLAQVSLALGRHCQALGLLERARALVGESIQLFNHYPPGTGLAEAYHILGQIEYQTGATEAAQTAYQNSLEIYRHAEIETGIASNLISLGVIAKNRGEFSRATQLYSECMQIFEQRNDQRGIWTCLINLGNIANVQENYQEALRLYQEALLAVQPSGDPSRLALTLVNLGSVARETCDLDAAFHYYQDSLNTSRKIGDQRILTASLDGLGKTYLKRGNLTLARNYLAEAARSAQQAGLLPQLLDSLVSLGLLHLEQDSLRLALRILMAITRHPACPAHVKQQADEGLAKAASRINTQEIKRWQEETSSIEEIFHLALETPATE